MQQCAIIVEASTQQTEPTVWLMVNPAITAENPTTSKVYAD